MTELETEFQTGKRGADRAVLLAHGAGADMHALVLTAFADAVQDAGGDATLHVYAGEGHGWKRPETVADALRRTDDFLTRKVLQR